MKKTFAAYLFPVLMVLMCNLCKAQTYQPGYMVLADGTRIPGMLLLDDVSPWYNQRYVFFKDSTALAADLKLKGKKYKVDNLTSYQAGTRTFDKIHYVDMGNLQLKSMGSNDHMMERLAAGRINAHRFYSYPPDVEISMASNEDELREREKKQKSDLINGYKIFVQKDNDTKLQNAFDVDMQKYFEDTPDVLQKYQSGAYGNQPIVAKKGLAARMVAMAKKAAFKPEEANGIIAACNEYNEKNAAKK